MNELRRIWRGKREDKNTWIEGCTLIQDPDLKEFIIEGYNYYTDADGLQRELYCYKIISSTLGECIGKRDKNNVAVFEGDFIANDKGIYLVEWNEEKMSFCFRPIYTTKLFTIVSDYKVVGNIYDNPKLLEVDYKNFDHMVILNDAT